MLAGLGDEMPSVLRLGRRPLGFVAQIAGPLDGLIPPALGAAQLALEVGAVGRGAGRALAQRRQLALERAALTLERAEGLGVRLELLFPLPDLGTLLAEPSAHLLLGLGPPRQLFPDPLVLDGRGVPIGRRGVPLP